MLQHLLCRYKAALFDLDGTLIDSMHAWDNICRDWLSVKGIKAEDILEDKTAIMTLEQAAEYIISVYNISIPPCCIKKEWEEMVLHKYKYSIKLKDGATELLKLFFEKGLRLGIVTSCFPTACEAVLSRYGIRDYFSAVLYTDDVNRNKTFPDVFLACAEKLDVEPENCIVFEDLYAAINGIRSARMGAVAVYDESGANQWEEFKNQADFAVLSLREVITGTNEGLAP